MVIIFSDVYNFIKYILQFLSQRKSVFTASGNRECVDGLLMILSNNNVKRNYQKQQRGSKEVVELGSQVKEY